MSDADDLRPAAREPSFRSELPTMAAWLHVESREGFEVVFIRRAEEGFRFEGTTVAVQDGQSWCVAYQLTVNRDGLTRSAEISCRHARGTAELQLELDRHGHWRADGSHLPEVDGCLDVDLEASALTNSLPVRRLRLRPGESASPPAVYVRVPDLRVERLGQRYKRSIRKEEHSYHYAAPGFDFTTTLRYDPSGLVLDYPGIARRRL